MTSHHLLLWLLLVYGITVVVTTSSIAKPLRDRDPTRLLKCPMCFGFWVGLGLTFAALGPAAETWPLWAAAPANAFCASAWCWIMHVTLTHLGADKL